MKTKFQRRLESKLKEINLDFNSWEKEYITQREELYKKINTKIGNTPIREIQLKNNNKLIQKLETHNLTETHYDRCYPELIKRMEKDGLIKPEDLLLEVTSGSAGISFAVIASLLGYYTGVFMDSKLPKARIHEVTNQTTFTQLIESEGRYMRACADAMLEYKRDNNIEAKKILYKIWFPNHSVQMEAPQGFADIATEVHHQYPDKKIDYFIGAIGNGTTIKGIGSQLIEFNSETKIIGWEPETGCPYYRKYLKTHGWGKCDLKLTSSKGVTEGFQMHNSPGSGGTGLNKFVFMDEAIEEGLIHDIIPIDDKGIYAQVRNKYNSELAPEEQQGNTSIASRYIAEQIAKKVSGKTFLTIAYDRADRYGLPNY